MLKQDLKPLEKGVKNFENTQLVSNILSVSEDVKLKNIKEQDMEK